MTKQSKKDKKKDKKKAKKTSHADEIAKIMKTPRASPKFNLDKELRQGYHKEAIDRIMKDANALVSNVI
jgi:arsenate reductase-like glutaredoxin family protein